MAQSGNSSVRRGAQAPLQGAAHPPSTHPHEPMPLPYHWHEKQVSTYTLLHQLDIFVVIGQLVGIVVKAATLDLLSGPSSHECSIIWQEIQYLHDGTIVFSYKRVRELICNEFPCKTNNRCWETIFPFLRHINLGNHCLEKNK